MNDRILYRRHRRSSTVAVLDWLCVFLTNYQPCDTILGETGGTYFPSEFKDYMSSFGIRSMYICAKENSTIFILHLDGIIIFHI